jgi:hypothetical protein
MKKNQTFWVTPFMEISGDGLKKISRVFLRPDIKKRTSKREANILACYITETSKREPYLSSVRSCWGSLGMLEPHHLGTLESQDSQGEAEGRIPEKNGYDITTYNQSAHQSTWRFPKSWGYP